MKAETINPKHRDKEQTWNMKPQKESNTAPETRLQLLGSSIWDSSTMSANCQNIIRKKKPSWNRVLQTGHWTFYWGHDGRTGMPMTLNVTFLVLYGVSQQHLRTCESTVSTTQLTGSNIHNLACLTPHPVALGPAVLSDLRVDRKTNWKKKRRIWFC